MNEAISKSSNNTSVMERSAWLPSVVCLMLCCSTFYLITIYSALHWDILSNNYESLNEEVRKSLFSMLSKLEFYRVFGFGSVIFLVLTFRGKPKWLGWFCVPFVLAAIFSSVIVM